MLTMKHRTNCFQTIRQSVKYVFVKILRRIQLIINLCIDRYGSNADIHHDILLQKGFESDQKRFHDAACTLFNGTFRRECAHNSSEESMRSIVTMESHRLEKSLSMPDRRIASAQDVVVRLIDATVFFFEKFGDSETIRLSLSTIQAYLSENPAQYLSQATKESLNKLNTIEHSIKHQPPKMPGGILVVDFESRLKPFTGKSNNTLKTTRHSIRDYLKKEVPRSLVEEITQDAMSSPSVCNRQEWKLYAIDNKSLIDECLSYQNGNRGFGHLVPLLFVVAVDLRSFLSIEERNQGWIDGGIFSMNLMHSIHSRGLGSCALNWCATSENDQKLRSTLDIPNHEIIIMMLAAGYPPEKLRVTMSSRRPVTEVLYFR